jgi:hypothetical protein
MSRRRLASVFAVAGIAIVAIGLTTGAATAGSSSKGDGIGTAKFATGTAGGNFSSSAVTIPYFKSSFTDPTHGKTYAYTMVGSNPSGNGSTTIPTVIIPLRFTFAASVDPSFHTLDGTNAVANTVASPVFQSANIGAAANATASAPPQPPDAPPGVAPDPRIVNEPSDVTQLGDAIYRAQWGKSGTGYHVLLGQPTVLPTQSIDVPQNQGFIAVGSSSGAHIGLMSISWFASKLNNLVVSMHTDPKVLAIFLVDNTFLYIHDLRDPNNCCVLGYHNAKSSLNGNGKQQVNTYMFASYTTPGIFGPNAGDSESYIADIHALSHEVQEWYDDPFINNVVDPWLTPTAPSYGCSADLETGDPIVGYGFKVAMPNGVTYHPEDEVHYSWFARESPSRAAGGYYTYLNNFADRAKGC